MTPWPPPHERDYLAEARVLLQQRNEGRPYLLQVERGHRLAMLREIGTDPFPELSGIKGAKVTSGAIVDDSRCYWAEDADPPPVWIAQMCVILMVVLLFIGVAYGTVALIERLR